MPQSLVCVPVHFIWSTKHREPQIDPTWADRVYDYFGVTAKNDRCILVAAGGMPDHVHLLLMLSREHSLAEIVRILKASSSRWIHDTMPGATSFQWQAGYGAFAVSFSMMDRVKQYIARQVEHHATLSFQDEFREFCQKHEVPIDERYVWD